MRISDSGLVRYDVNLLRITSSTPFSVPCLGFQEVPMLKPLRDQDLAIPSSWHLWLLRPSLYLASPYRHPPPGCPHLENIPWKLNTPFKHQKRLAHLGRVITIVVVVAPTLSLPPSTSPRHSSRSRHRDTGTQLLVILQILPLIPRLL